jgi:hypothetical protein
VHVVNTQHHRAYPQHPPIIPCELRRRRCPTHPDNAHPGTHPHHNRLDNSIGTPPLAEKAAAGALKVDVTTVLPLEQATDGLASIAGGKIVVKIAD